MGDWDKTCWVKAKVVSIKGTCHAGHQLGDEAVFTDTGVEGKLCFDAMCTMVPKAWGMRYNAELPWQEDPAAPVRHACPDAANPVVFELSKVPRK